MVKTKLLKVSYRDAANAISLTAYADTLVSCRASLRGSRLWVMCSQRWLHLLTCCSPKVYRRL
jgi:hypothetical protein